MTSPTMEEIEATINCIGDHDLVHIRFGLGYLDCKTWLVREAWKQIKHKVGLIQNGIIHPEECRAEALLLMIFQDAYYHGYTPTKS